MKKTTIENYGEIEFKIPNAREYIRMQRIAAEHPPPADEERITLSESIGLVEMFLDALEGIEMKKDGGALDTNDIPPAYIPAVYSAVTEATLTGK